MNNFGINKLIFCFESGKNNTVSTPLNPLKYSKWSHRKVIAIFYTIWFSNRHLGHRDSPCLSDRECFSWIHYEISFSLYQFCRSWMKFYLPIPDFSVILLFSVYLEDWQQAFSPLWYCYCPAKFLVDLVRWRSHLFGRKKKFLVIKKLIYATKSATFSRNTMIKNSLYLYKWWQ